MTSSIKNPLVFYKLGGNGGNGIDFDVVPGWFFAGFNLHPVDTDELCGILIFKQLLHHFQLTDSEGANPAIFHFNWIE